MKYASLFLCGLLLTTTVNAQSKKTPDYKTTVQFHTNMAYFDGMGELWYGIFNPQGGLSVVQAIDKHFSVGVSYQRWLMPGAKNTDWSMTHTNGGMIYSRRNYSFADAFARYNLRLNRQRIYIGTGVSSASGYIAYTEPLPEYGPICVISVDEEYERKMGGVAFIGIERLLAGSRLNLGCNATYRYYSPQFKQYELGINLGYNFSLRNRSADTDN